MYLWFPEVTFTTAKISWSPPEEPNGIITGYIVSYRIKDSNVVWNSSELVESQRELRVVTLQREKYYIFSVRARTRQTMGWGASAEARVYTAIDRRKLF